jgi:uncharacterized protein
MSTRVAAILLSLASLQACAHSPDPRMYVLTEREGASASGSSAIVQVDRPHLPGYLERREIVQRVADQQLGVASHAIWAESLEAMIGRVMALDLAQRSPSARVYSETSGLGVRPDLHVALDVRRFEQERSGDVVLVALVLVRRAEESRPIVLEQVTLRRTPSARDTAGIVEALSGLLGTLADRIAPTIAAAGSPPDANGSPAPPPSP